MSPTNIQPIVTPSNYSPVVIVLDWFILVLAVLVSVARLITKRAVLHPLDASDVLICAAMVTNPAVFRDS